mmetsp:Transcript_14285/g.18718  ORF Transcript_14285/g.18718 Transcript_14285/m.18718 type:complete len:263 (-) Transcript_14285:247-1035(-)|eukprot:CAMPEP_0117740570 /NCGR_PEP_ID=MMETSP0947-20121206/4421_1 /TAXON_ID=44440 /ORGANISM="Chattonella subsalsa, Strain CCMP2191" /LENGTH=262 /DNA_ID=CAMNT_0005556711 /DNA_START=111 /DNA_END=899 /DNA_ORIENTATION=+
MLPKWSTKSSEKNKGIIPIGKVLRTRAVKNKKRKHTTNSHEDGDSDINVSINSIEAQIAALEKELEKDSNSSSTSEHGETNDEVSDKETSEDSDSEIQKKTPERNKKKKGKKDNLTSDSTKFSSLDEERIIPLPASLLPQGKFKARESKVKSSSKSPIKKTGLEHAVEELLSNYQPTSAERRPHYCRVCMYQGTSVEDLAQHRDSDFHKLAIQKERKMSFCQLCKKQFTSPAQLQEHVSGKMHKEKLNRRKQSQQKFMNHGS